MTKILKIAGSGSRSISQRQGSSDPDPDPRQNVMDLEHYSQFITVRVLPAACRDAEGVEDKPEGDLGQIVGVTAH
jgi:hypothetical protein